MIKFGDIEYFELLSFQDKLKKDRLNRLGIASLEKIRMDVHIMVEQIHLREKESRDQEWINEIRAMVSVAEDGELDGAWAWKKLLERMQSLK